MHSSPVKTHKLTKPSPKVLMSLLLFLLLVLGGSTFFGRLFIDLPQFFIHTSQSALSFFLLVLILGVVGGVLGD
jgi:hypothetical protein